MIKTHPRLKKLNKLHLSLYTPFLYPQLLSRLKSASERVQEKRKGIILGFTVELKLTP